jgi:hypothetical protein
VIDLLVPVAAGLLGGLGLLLVLRLVDDWAVSRRARRPADDALRPVAPRRRNRRRLLSGAVAVALIVGGLAWLRGGGYLDPLRAEGPVSGSGALYLGTVPATFGGRDSVDFAEVPGGYVEYGFTLRNDSDSAVTVTAIGDPVNGQRTWADGLFDTGGLLPLGQAAGSGFPAFDIGPRSAVRVTLALHLRYCTTWLATPTLAPSTSPSAWAALAVKSALGGGTGGGSLTFEKVYVVYSEGLAGGTASLELPAGLELVERDGAGCPIGNETPAAPMATAASG